jgi:hypothetical protein
MRERENRTGTLKHPATRRAQRDKERNYTGGAQ